HSYQLTMLAVGAKVARPFTFKKCCDLLVSPEGQRCYLQLKQLSGLPKYPTKYILTIGYFTNNCPQTTLQQQQIFNKFPLTLNTFSTTTKCLSEAAPKHYIATNNDVSVLCAKLVTNGMVFVSFSDGTSGEFPCVWMRDNCQCSKCYNTHALARTTLLDDLDVDVEPTSIKVSDDSLQVAWSDGHQSEFEASWLKKRLFTPEAREQHRTRFKLKRVLWGDNFQIPEIEYSPLLTDDKALLDLIVAVEKHGIALVKNSPQEVGPVLKIIDRLGFVKHTHFGYDYNVTIKFEPKSMAYTKQNLPLHTDQPYYEYPPGVVFLHCVSQHKGPGGDSILSDGIKAAELLRKNYPEYFNTLASTDLYLRDRGFVTYDFDKINKNKTIVLDGNGEVRMLFYSGTSRDSLMDLEPKQVIKFYKAMKQFYQYFQDCRITMKMESGDMLVIDNSRVLHGRTAFNPSESSGMRHLHSANIDWNEVASKRRVLQDKFSLHLE
ncbi:unnamed protein product, partial [Meganyctiphanes norvegica]